MKTKGVKMANIILFIIYLCCSALGLLFIKLGSTGFTFGINTGNFYFNMNYKMLIGIIFYICSFLLFILILPRFNLTYIYPLGAGLIYIFISLMGFLILKETITLWQLTGMVLILLGVVAMNIKR